MALALSLAAKMPLTMLANENFIALQGFHLYVAVPFELTA
jgi:hypothetical protein